MIRQMICPILFKQKERKIKVTITYSLFGGVGGGGESSTDETLKVSKLTEVSPLMSMLSCPLSCSTALVGGASL